MNTKDRKHLLLDQVSIQKRTAELGDEISRDYKDKNLLVIGVLKGAFVFMADLIRTIQVPLTVDFIQVSSYGSQTETSGSIQLKKKPDGDVKGRDVLIVEDIIDTGLTMQWLIDHFSDQGAASVRVCTLIDKGERRQHAVAIDYTGFQIPKGFLVGCGLDFNEQHRQYGDIFHLTPGAE